MDLLLRNLRPELQKMVRRTDNLTIEGLFDSATEAELVLEAEKHYRTPSSPESSLLPEMAFVPPLGERRSRAKLAAVQSDPPATAKPATKQEKAMVEAITQLAKLLNEQLQ